MEKRKKLKIQRCVLCGSQRSDENVAHFTFPKDKFAEWRSFCMEVDPTKPIFSSSKLCCIHFTQNSFSSLFHRHVLKKNAVPSLNSNSNNQESIIRKCNHNLIQHKPKLVTKKRSYGWHQGSKYCLLCRSRRTAVASFSFPKDDKIRQQWLEFCQVDDTDIKIGSRLCQYHFTDDDFRRSNCGRVYLKSGAIPSIRSVTIEKLHNHRNEDVGDLDCNENIENVDCYEDIDNVDCNEDVDNVDFNEDVDNVDCNEDVDNVDCNEDVGDVDYIIPPKKLRSCNDLRFDDPESTILLCEADKISSTDETLEVGECSFCKMTTVDLVKFQFSNNTAMRLFMMTKCGLSPLYLDMIHEVCISHFDSGDIDIDNDREKSVRDGAFPWSYLSQMITNRNCYTSEADEKAKIMCG